MGQCMGQYTSLEQIGLRLSLFWYAETALFNLRRRDLISGRVPYDSFKLSSSSRRAVIWAVNSCKSA